MRDSSGVIKFPTLLYIWTEKLLINFDQFYAIFRNLYYRPHGFIHI